MIMMINDAFVPLTSLIDIDECQTKSCPDNSICKNTRGNFTSPAHVRKVTPEKLALVRAYKSMQNHTLNIKFTNDVDCQKSY